MHANSKTVLHLSCRTFFSGVCLGGLPVAWILIWLRHSGHATFQHFLEGTSWGLLTWAVGSYLVCRCCPVELSPHGVRAFSALGWRRFIAWNQIERIRPITIFNLTYLRLEARDASGAVWFPLFFAKPGFEQELARYCPASHPLMDYLR